MPILGRKARTNKGLGNSNSSAFRIDARGNVLDQSQSAGPLVALWQSDAGSLHETVHEALTSGFPVDARIDDGAGSTYWLVAVPQGKECVVVTRDTTLPDKVTEALLKSRAMLKELLDGSVDVAFELDSDLRFRFVSPHSAFGEETELWLGRYATQVFWPEGNAPARNPFAAFKAAEMEDVSATFGDGQRRWLHFMVYPQTDDQGNLIGVRGTCRDMTERHKSAQKTRQEGLRFRLLQRITGILNTAESSDELFDRASSALQEVVRADMVWAAMHYDEGLVPSSIVGDYHEILDLDAIWQKLQRAEVSVLAVGSEGRRHLALRMQRADSTLGMMIVSRDTSVSPWAEQELELLSDVIDVLTAAFGKAELIETLYRLSSKDELTGLLNRRALTEAVERRLKHQRRTGLSGCLVFIDLDHFKEVNDTLGHKAGDDALKAVADRMQAMIRPCDFAGRYGGDEFILWLEDMTAENAAKKAQSLINAMPAIRNAIGAEDLRLNASIGVCPSRPGIDLTFTTLAERADAVLYDVKAAGRAHVAIAPQEQENSTGGEE